MAAERRDPYRNFNFRVAIGGKARASDGYSGVRLPALTIGNEIPPALVEERHLILRRGYTGSSDLREWWEQERKAPQRSRGRIVTVELLDESADNAVTAWRFLGCRPVALHYSPLDALESAVMTETITLAFDDVVIE